MKKWALLTLGLYLAALSAVCMPLFLILGAKNPDLPAPFYLFVVPVLLAVAGVLLFIPAAAARGRPVRRRAAVTSAAIGAIPMAFLLVAFGFNVLIMEVPESNPSWEIINRHAGWCVFMPLGVLWTFWSVVFYRAWRADDPMALTRRATGWLLKGSILEVIVAIPSHVLSRQREECCAPAISLLGIATGLSVALLSFGPALLLLFAARMERKASGGRSKPGAAPLLS